MMAIPPVLGVILILFGLVLFIVDLSVTNHGLLTAGAIVTLLAGGLALFGAGVPYSGVLLGALVVVSMLMGGLLLGVLGSLRSLRGKPALTGMEGMIGETGTVRSPVGVNLRGVGVRSRGKVARPASIRPRGDRSARGRTRRRGGAQGEGRGFRRGRGNAGGAHKTTR